MINKKLLEVLTSHPDTALSIVTQGLDGPHLVNSWNHYTHITSDGKLLFPVGGMNETEKNISRDNKVILSITNREVEGKRYKGTGFLIKGTGEFLVSGSDFDEIKSNFPWARAALSVEIKSAEQTL